MSNRQTGRTTQQMKDAPVGAVYVWCNSQTGYPRQLAMAIGRDDLQVVPFLWLDGRNVRGRTFKGVTVDHAAHCDADAYEALDYLRTRGVLVAG